MIQHTSIRRSGPRLVALFLALLIMALGVMTAAAAPTCTTTCYVDVASGDDTNDGTTAGTALKTIQAAVNQVTPGGQIFALTGTYPESVLVNKAVTITGDGPTLTIIDPVTYVQITSSDVTLEDLAVVNGGTHGVRVENNVNPLANITFDNVHFKNNPQRGLEISGMPITNIQVLNSLFDGNTTGIRMSSSAVVDGFVIDNTTFQNHPNTSSGMGFYQANDGNGGYVKDLHVTQSTFTGNGFSGIYVEEPIDMLVETSDFTGNSRGVMLFDWYASAVANGTLNQITNNTFTDNTAASVMVLAGNGNGLGEPASVDNNTFTQDVGALAANWSVIDVRLANGFTHAVVDVDNNDITFSGTYGVATAAYGIRLRGGVDEVNITNNELDGGSVGNNGGTPATAGIYVSTNDSFYGAMKGATDIEVTRNLINNFPNGVVVYDPVGLSYGNLPAGASLMVNRNDLADNTTYGIQSGPSTESDGTCNWWGDISGPSGEGPGSGSAVSTDVNYTPWLYSDDLDGPCYIGGTIEVVKEAGDVGDEFEFDPSWSDDNFFLGSGDSQTSDPLPAGTYSVEEVNLPPGWSLDNASCVNEGGLASPVTPVDPSNIPVEDYDAWVCTFTNVYTPPPTNICPVEGASNLYTDILGQGMGSTKKHKTQLKLNVPNSGNLETLYGQMVAKDFGKANYVRFILPGKNNYVQVDSVTSPIDHTGGNFWYGDYIDPAQYVKGRWFLQPTGVKGHIPRALILYPTYEDDENTYVNVWDTYDASEGEVYWDAASGWTPYRQIIVPIAPPNGPTTFHVELAVVDNDKDNRRVWVTVTAGGVTQTVSPNNPDSGDLLNLLTFDLPNVPQGTDEIIIEIASYEGDGVHGDSASLVGMAANYECAPLD